MSENPQQTHPSDPFDAMIKFYEAWSQSWSKAMAEAASSERTAEAVGRQMDAQLESLAQARKGFGEWMEAYLHAINLPTGADITGLAERLAALEIRLDDLDAKLDEILDRLKN